MNNYLVKGFTLLEILVVLVILGMTTVLLSTGLTTTWQNFQRLGARDLIVTSSQLPAQWFRDSVQHALLYHPNKPVVRGDARSFELVSAAVPNDAQGIPQTMQWSIAEKAGEWTLSFNTLEQAPTVIKRTNLPLRIEYKDDGQWTDVFEPTVSRLPEVVRIIEGDVIWLVAIPGRPLLADIPADIKLFGEYEF